MVSHISQFNAAVAMPHGGSVSLLGAKFSNQQSAEFGGLGENFFQVSNKV